MALSITAHASIEGSYTHATDRSKGTYPLPGSNPITFSNGTGNGKVGLAFDDERTLLSNTSENLDLAGSLQDAFGATLTFAKIKAVEIEADAANTTNITIGNAASNGAQLFFGGATGTLVLQPGDRFVWASSIGWPVTAATADLLKIANATGASATYRVKLVGE